ncbi:vacuolar cation proton exchanger 3-like [Olea europaea subsp. europaea]|uniref:Vacuolar cation proton exchanger 3-like n=1 Tax=Olea europaea subsp. europaea TaxID=158383 RepID=A0A8S0RFF0_OLEEU|nr:vacuolar cation proton exchanger 3-like [Olea europaea subsp. europaea]
MLHWKCNRVDNLNACNEKWHVTRHSTVIIGINSFEHAVGPRLCFFVGGIVHYRKEQVFNKAYAMMNSGLLLMAVMGLLFSAVLHFMYTELHFGKSELVLSRFSSCIMLIAYGAYLFFQLTSEKTLYSPINEGASAAMNIPVAFISVILLSIVGNTAEHVDAIMFAVKDKLIPFCVVVGWIMGRPMDLSFQLFETATLFMTVLVVAFMLQVRS